MNQRIKELIDEGYLSYKEEGKLYLLNYTDKATYDKKWNKYTLNSRGHVYEKGTDRLIAKPFSKFFNMSELAVSKSRNLLKKKNYTITEKLDGSLGVIYFYDGKWRINTRGSFKSEQAVEAMKILEKKV